MPEPVVNRIVVGGILAIFSLISAIAMQIGYSTNSEINRLAIAVADLTRQVALIEQRIEQLPPMSFQIKVDRLESRIKRLEEDYGR